jgi:hypothetical protein
MKLKGKEVLPLYDNLKLLIFMNRKEKFNSEKKTKRTEHGGKGAELLPIS